MTVKVLLDTDIGSDIDDALCLAYLLRQPQCELLGITTVSGEAENRAELASALCTHMGQDVPIVAGCENPILFPQRQPRAPQAAVLASWPHKAGFTPGLAVDFLRETIHQHKDEVILLAVGPLTNLGLLFTIDPQVPRLLRGLVTMAGIFEAGKVGSLREWNVLCDPIAAAIVHRAPVRRHVCIGLNVTMQLTLPSSVARERFRASKLGPVDDAAEVWLTGNDTITFHDPLAGAVIFREDLCRLEPGEVLVEPLREEEYGQTRFVPEPTGSREVATEVHADAFFEHYFSVVSSTDSRQRD